MLRRTKASKWLWDYAAIYVSEVRSRTAHQMYELHGRTPYEIVAGDTPDITEWLEYDFYQPASVVLQSSRVSGRKTATQEMDWSCT